MVNNLFIFLAVAFLKLFVGPSEFFFPEAFPRSSEGTPSWMDTLHAACLPLTQDPTLGCVRGHHSGPAHIEQCLLPLSLVVPLL